MRLSLIICFSCISALLGCRQEIMFKAGTYVAKYPGDIKAGLLKVLKNGFYSLGDSLVIYPEGSFEYFSKCNNSESFGSWNLQNNQLVLMIDTLYKNGSLIHNNIELSDLVLKVERDHVMILEEASTIVSTNKRAIVKYYFVLHED